MASKTLFAANGRRLRNVYRRTQLPNVAEIARPHLKLVKQKLVLREIMNTEWKYNADLHMVLAEFLEPLEKIVGHADCQLIFQNMRELIEISDSLASRFSVAPTADNELGIAVANALLAVAPVLHLFVPYMVGFSLAIETLDRVRRISRVSRFLSARAPLLRMLDMRDFLILPVQRLCKYPLLLRELLGATPLAHESHDPIESAFVAISAAVEGVNDAVRDRQSAARVDALSRQFGNTIPKASIDRRLRSETTGVLYRPAVSRHVLMSSPGAPRRSDGVLVFLFSDVLVLARERTKGGFSVILSIPAPETALVVADVPEDWFGVPPSSFVYGRGESESCSLVLDSSNEVAAFQTAIRSPIKRRNIAASSAAAAAAAANAAAELAAARTLSRHASGTASALSSAVGSAAGSAVSSAGNSAAAAEDERRTPRTPATRSSPCDPGAPSLLDTVRKASVYFRPHYSRAARPPAEPVSLAEDGSEWLALLGKSDAHGRPLLDPAEVLRRVTSSTSSSGLRMHGAGAGASTGAPGYYDLFVAKQAESSDSSSTMVSVESEHSELSFGGAESDEGDAPRVAFAGLPHQHSSHHHHHHHFMHVHASGGMAAGAGTLAPAPAGSAHSSHVLHIAALSHAVANSSSGPVSWTERARRMPATERVQLARRLLRPLQMLKHTHEGAGKAHLRTMRIGVDGVVSWGEGLVPSAWKRMRVVGVVPDALPPAFDASAIAVAASAAAASAGRGEATFDWQRCSLELQCAAVPDPFEVVDAAPVRSLFLIAPTPAAHADWVLAAVFAVALAQAEVATAVGSAAGAAAAGQH